jgi:tetratricopeptide (TPR) repeat protein
VPLVLIFLALLRPAASVVPSRGEEIPEGLQAATRALYRGEYDRAGSLAQGYLQAHPQAMNAQILLARARISHGQYEPALEGLERVLRRDPANPDALYYLERLSGLLSQMEFQRLFRLAPDSARARQVMGEAYETQNKLELAETEYQAALKADPQLVEVLDALGDLKRHQFKFDDAIRYYSRALEAQPRDYTSAYGLGAAYLFKQNPPEAVRFLRLAVAIDPQSPAARLALGDALLRVGHGDAAVTELKASISLAPDLRQAYTLLARAYRILGRTEEASAALRKSQELNREEIEAREKTLGSQEKTPR